ncbi:endo alpha-1,4 polygalactosaminidase [Frondihabitans australicus]|uniref:Glycosyl hydrolase family 114 n=1 Tax=Frondihabitans australicus TaxID=386892 RepID=A0A495IM93_9MICO|nr:endo alpha-1,4 polygalactosaminidase [Frondihabitans australicus]RKR76245.1 glycosyl hydrolase family 114 [Frondihabitans australicus]
MKAASRILLALTIASGLMMAGAGCSYSAGSPQGDSEHVDRVLPPTTGAADYQLGGAYTPPKGVTVVTRDSTSKPAKGVYSICYVNGFQTQPDVKWPSDLILHAASGAPLVDPGWPDEHIIDISTAAKRTAAAKIIAKSTDLCARKGFSAVEFDNLDSYTRSKKQLTLDDAIAFAKLLVAEAHDRDLAAGQKNTDQLGSRGKTQIGYDFAVSEECDTFDECDQYTRVYGKHVIDIEYTDDLRGTFAQVCARKHTPPMTELRDRDLTTPGSKDYVYRSC